MDSSRAQSRRGRSHWRCALAGLCAVLLAAGAERGRAAEPCGQPVGEVDPVAVDARLDVTLDDGRVVRIGGLDAAAARGAPEMARAGADFLAGLLLGKRARLVLIAVQPDRWGRTVADLALDDGQTAANALLAAGFARVRPEFETRACAPGRIKLENEARRAGRGLWSDPELGVIDASNFGRLRRQDGQFVVVEGKVRRVGSGRTRFYVDLGAYGGATLVVGRKLEPVFVRAGTRVGALRGRIVRGRGPLDMRFGPRIEISEPAMLEVSPDGARRSDASGDELRRP